MGGTWQPLQSSLDVYHVSRKEKVFEDKQIQYCMRFQLSMANTSSELDQIENSRALDSCAVATAG